MPMGRTRREFLGWLGALAVLGGERRWAAGAPPACAPTPSQTEGPYFKAGAPRRSSLLEPGVDGVRLTVAGTVRRTDCAPVAGARLDFWQADAAGRYDNTGFGLRGHQLTGADGRYRLETVVPGLYPGRTRHLHVRVEAPGHPVLTTQLYFPDEPGNRRDGIFRPALVMPVRDGEGGKQAVFDFVLADRSAGAGPAG